MKGIWWKKNPSWIGWFTKRNLKKSPRLQTRWRISWLRLRNILLWYFVSSYYFRKTVNHDITSKLLSDDKEDKQDIRILNELENIDDELDKEGIVIVRMDDEDEAKEYGLDTLPALVYFENHIPTIYEGDLMNEEEVLEW